MRQKVGSRRWRLAGAGRRPTEVAEPCGRGQGGGKIKTVLFTILHDMHPQGMRRIFKCSAHPAGPTELRILVIWSRDLCGWFFGVLVFMVG